MMSTSVLYLTSFDQHQIALILFKMRKRLVNKLCQIMLQSIKVTSSFVRRYFTPTFTFVLTGYADAADHLTCRRV